MKIITKIKRKISYSRNAKYINAMRAVDKNLTEKKAYNRMMSALNNYSIPKDKFVEQQYFRLNKSLMRKYMTDDATRGRVDCIADLAGKPRGFVMAKTERARKKYNLSLYYFAYNNLVADCSDKNLEKHKVRFEKRKDALVAQLVNITGWSKKEVISFCKDIEKKYQVSYWFVKDHELFKKNEQEIDDLIKKLAAEDEERIEKIKKANNWSDYELEYDRIKCRMKYSVVEMESYDNLGFWHLSDDVRETFATPRDCFRLGAKYNKVSTKVLDDKTLFDQTYAEFLGRKFWINRNTTIEEFKEFIEGLDEVFCKPVNLLGGHGAYKYKLDGTLEEMYDYFMKESRMLIEEIPKQHHLVNEIYDKCIDSVRIMSVLKDDEFHAFGAWMKFGAGGSIVDGRVDGGSFAAVDEKTGVIISGALNGNNEFLEFHPDTGARILGFQIPYWDEVLDLAERALRHVKGIGFVGWDIAICEDGPIIIEGNSKPAFISYQLLYSQTNEGQKYKYEAFL